MFCLQIIRFVSNAKIFFFVCLFDSISSHFVIWVLKYNLGGAKVVFSSEVVSFSIIDQLPADENFTLTLIPSNRRHPYFFGFASTWLLDLKKGLFSLKLSQQKQEKRPYRLHCSLLKSAQVNS